VVRRKPSANDANCGSLHLLKKSGFLRIPSEMRNAIYKQVIGGKGSSEVTMECRLRVPSLAVVNRQIRSELLPIYLDQTDFKMELRLQEWSFNGLISWARAVAAGIYLPLIRSLHIQVELSEDERDWIFNLNIQRPELGYEYRDKDWYSDARTRLRRFRSYKPDQFRRLYTCIDDEDMDWTDRGEVGLSLNSAYRDQISLHAASAKNPGNGSHGPYADHSESDTKEVFKEFRKTWKATFKQLILALTTGGQLATKEVEFSISSLPGLPFYVDEDGNPESCPGRWVWWLSEHDRRYEMAYELELDDRVSSGDDWCRNCGMADPMSNSCSSQVDWFENWDPDYGVLWDLDRVRKRGRRFGPFGSYTQTGVFVESEEDDSDQADEDAETGDKDKTGTNTGEDQAGETEEAGEAGEAE